MDARREPGLRLFLAATLPPGHLDSLEPAVASLKARLPRARWIPRQNWHITLSFLGQVPDAKLPGIIRAAERTAAEMQTIQSRLMGLGAFPGKHRARVLWVGVADVQKGLAQLAARLGEACGAPDVRTYHPHLTLARFNVPASIEEVIGQAEPLELERSCFQVDRVVLFRSDPGRQGSVYVALAEFGLSASGPGRL